MFGQRKELIKETIEVIKTINPDFQMPLNLNNSKQTLYFLEEQLIKEREQLQKRYNENLTIINNPNTNSQIVSFGYYIDLELSKEKEINPTYVICLKYNYSNYWIEIYNSKSKNNNRKIKTNNIYQNINFDTFKHEGILEEDEINTILSFIKEDMVAFKIFMKYVTEQLDYNIELEQSIK